MRQEEEYESNHKLHNTIGCVSLEKAATRRRDRSLSLGASRSILARPPVVCGREEASRRIRIIDAQYCNEIRCYNEFR